MRQLKFSSDNRLNRTSSGCESLCFDLLNAVTIIHIAHLGITGPGSYATHKALGDFYDAVGDFADDVIEHYQGVTGKLMEFPDTCSIPKLKSAEACCAYLKNLRAIIDKEQQGLPYSEIVNTLDEVKSLIDSTCYKLTFLK
jgi:DNA-binding ferritin-like protein